jgi:hypothetical protein
MARFYLGRFYTKLQKFKSNFQIFDWNKTDIRYLLLWLRFLEKAHKSILMNLLTFRKPSNIVISDACPGGLGGFSIITGKAWRYQLPENHGLHNNALEWLVNVVSIWLGHTNVAVEDMGNILALTDNSSCVGWMH